VDSPRLRLSDNQALSAALLHGGSVFPVFILDPSLIYSRYCGQKRLSFLFDGLARLGCSLRNAEVIFSCALESNLILKELLHQTGSDVIYAEEDYSPYAVSRDRPIVGLLPLILLQVYLSTTRRISLNPIELLYSLHPL